MNTHTAQLTDATAGRAHSAQDQFRREPHRFEFFQAVRLLRWIAHCEGDQQAQVASGVSPEHELVRFRAVAAHAFPQGSVVDVIANQGHATTEMQVAFMGLFGPSGVLPRHYTQLIIDRCREKDATLRDFLDLFNQRFIAHFYRAWAKHRLPIAYEQAQLDESISEDCFTKGLYSLVGWGLNSVKGRLEIHDAAFVYYGGHFSHSPRNAISLEAIVGDYFQIEAKVCQFAGQWLYLDRADQSRLSNDRQVYSNHCLGTDVVVGDRVWGVENNFRIRLGPMRYQEFSELTPGSAGLTSLAQFVRCYVGPEFDFDIQLVLHRDEVPPCQLGADGKKPGARLGWNTWLHNESFREHVDDAVFVHNGGPSHP